MKSKPLNRRMMLKGLGGITVGLPLLEEMAHSAARTADKDVPVRAFNVFFGLGIPAPLQKEGYEGVLEPLKPFLGLRRLDQIGHGVAGVAARLLEREGLAEGEDVVIDTGLSRAPALSELFAPLCASFK